MSNYGTLHKIIPVGIFLIISIVFTLPIIENLSYWPPVGHDADELISYVALERNSVLKHLQFPFWTPFIGGGMNISAHPCYSFILSPFFIVILIFGEIVGLKILIIAHLFFGLYGMYLLARYLGCSQHSSYLPSFIFLLSSIYPLQVAEGVYYNISIVWVPWVFLYFLKSFNEQRYIYVSILFCILILFSGGVYPILFFLFLFLCIYSCILAIRNKNLKPLRIYIFFIIIVSLLGAVKILPMIEMVIKNHQFRPPTRYSNFQILLSSLFSRNQLLSVSRDKLWGVPANVSFWEYYGAYIGIVPFLIYLISIRRVIRMRPELVLSGLIFLVFSLISILPINKDNLPEGLNLFTLFYHFPRFIWMFIFSLSYVVSLGLSEFEKNYFKHKNFIAKMIIYGLTLFILSDLILVNGPILKEAFSRPPENIERGAYFVQTNKEEVYDQSSMYPTILSNQGIGVDGLTLFQGTFSLCHAIPFGSERYRGEAYLEGGKKDDLRVVHFSPNSVKIKLLTKKTDMLLLNQNYDSNWRVKGLSDNKIISTDGLISVKVTPEDTNGIITFYYLSDKFLYGLVLSLLAFILIIFHIRGFIPASIFKYTLFCLTAIFVVFILIEFRGPVNKSQEWHSGYQHAIKGISAYRHKNYAEAKEEIRQAVEYFPNSVILHQRLKEFYTIEGQKEKALIEQELIDELLPD